MTPLARGTGGLDRWTRGAREGLQRGWLALLPLALLPLINLAAVPYQMPARAAVVLAALLIWVWTGVSRVARPGAVALLARSASQLRIGPWEIALLVVAAGIAVLYVAVAAGVTEITTVDGAYYYGVARHMVLSGRFEEPIVWHFLSPPEHIVHAPFDYWGCATSLLLTPPLALFGAAPRTAFVTMGVLSAASVLAFWFLICIALPLRYCATQLLALLLFAFSPPMDRFRFQPESTVIAQLFLLVALIACCRRRFGLALLSGFGMLLTRGDGVILFSIIALYAVLHTYGDRAGAPTRVWRLALLGVGCAGSYVLWSLVSFGSAAPSAAQQVPFLNNIAQAFEFGSRPARTWQDVAGHFTGAYVLQSIQRAMEVRYLRFTPAWGWWIALSMLPLLAVVRHPGSPQSLIWILCVGGYFAAPWMGGVGFTLYRSAHTFVPLVVLAGALGLDMILARLDGSLEKRLRGGWIGWLIGAGVLAMCTTFLMPLPALQTWPSRADVLDQEQLAKLAPILKGEPVVSNQPCYLIAYTDSPAVAIPRNGEAALAAVMERYAVRWLVIFPDALRGAGPSKPALRRILTADEDAVGHFQLQRVPTDAGLPAVYRVVRTGD